MVQSSQRLIIYRFRRNDIALGALLLLISSAVPTELVDIVSETSYMSIASQRLLQHYGSTC